MKHYNAAVIKHLMLVKIGLAMITLVWLGFFTCKMEYDTVFTFDQKMVLVLLIVCCFYDDPFYFVVVQRPMLYLSVLAEIPNTGFYCTLLAYWLVGLAYVRKKASEMDTRKATIQDITGKLSRTRLFHILLLSTLAFIAQSVLHFLYLETETNRSVFSSFRHFEHDIGHT